VRDNHTVNKNNAILMSFAETLKMICVPIAAAFLGNSCYNILLGETSEARSMREVHHNTHHLGKISGRELLERVGTDCFRKVRDDFWISITTRKIQSLLKSSIKVVISDVRFTNEAKAVRSLGGDIIVIARSPDDLILTDADRLTHISKWQFLTFIQAAYMVHTNPASSIKNKETVHTNDSTKGDLVIINDGTIGDLTTAIKSRVYKTL
jgi:hypothetical protein